MTGRTMHNVATVMPDTAWYRFSWIAPLLGDASTLMCLWGCIHRHYFVTQLSHLLCARIRQEYDDGGEEQRLTIEQVRSAVNQWLLTCDLSPSVRKTWYEKEAKKQEYYQRRNYSARKSHTKTTRARYLAAGIDVDQIKSCIT